MINYNNFKLLSNIPGHLHKSVNDATLKKRLTPIRIRKILRQKEKEKEKEMKKKIKKKKIKNPLELKSEIKEELKQKILEELDKKGKGSKQIQKG